ncbi:hypothetical protein LSAT2_025007 [Lamellibrachia satsuma]|nr:hypothetical protein LSAT2_025007 [Lamellibrachia satsuma]
MVSAKLTGGGGRAGRQAGRQAGRRAGGHGGQADRRTGGQAGGLAGRQTNTNRDECPTTDSCPKNSRCINKQPWYECICLDGYVKFGRECIGGYPRLLHLTWTNVPGRVRTCDHSHGLCINTDGGFRCTCKAGYQGNGVNCQDIDECKLVNDCDTRPGVGVCTNTPGSYTCGCGPEYELAPNLKTCYAKGQPRADRNGQWGEWLSWGGCSASCGSGQHTRVRRCTNPTTKGSGRPCSGEESKAEVCNTQQCPLTDDEAKSGIILRTHGVPLKKLSQVFFILQETLAIAVNAFCNRNTSTVRKCCRLDTKYVPKHQHLKMFIQQSDIVQGAGYPKEAIDHTVTLLFVFKYRKRNPLCAAAALKSRREKRGAHGVVLRVFEDALDQALLQAVLNNPATKAVLVDRLERAIRSVFGVPSKITVTDVKSATQVPFYTSPPDSTESTTTISKKKTTGRGVRAWVVAVAVIAAIIGLTVIIVVVVVLCMSNGPALTHLLAKWKLQEQQHPKRRSRDLRRRLGSESAVEESFGELPKRRPWFTRRARASPATGTQSNEIQSGSMNTAPTPPKEIQLETAGTAPTPRKEIQPETAGTAPTPRMEIKPETNISAPNLHIPDPSSLPPPDI